MERQSEITQAHENLEVYCMRALFICSNELLAAVEQAKKPPSREAERVPPNHSIVAEHVRHTNSP